MQNKYQQRSHTINTDKNEPQYQVIDESTATERLRGFKPAAPNYSPANGHAMSSSESKIVRDILSSMDEQQQLLVQLQGNIIQQMTHTNTRGQHQVDYTAIQQKMNNCHLVLSQLTALKIQFQSSFGEAAQPDTTPTDSSAVSVAPLSSTTNINYSMKPTSTRDLLKQSAGQNHLCRQQESRQKTLILLLSLCRHSTQNDVGETIEIPTMIGKNNVAIRSITNSSTTVRGTGEITEGSVIQGQELNFMLT